MQKLPSAPGYWTPPVHNTAQHTENAPEYSLDIDVGGKIVSG